MEASVLAAANVSVLAMAVIFVILTILIFTIQMLVKFIPYQEQEPAPSQKVPVSGSSEHDDQVAAITSTLAAHMGKRPDEFRILKIQSH